MCTSFVAAWTSKSHSTTSHVVAILSEAHNINYPLLEMAYILNFITVTKILDSYRKKVLSSCPLLKLKQSLTNSFLFRHITFIFGPVVPLYNCFRSTFYKTDNKLSLLLWSHHCIELTKEKIEGASATLLKRLKRTFLSSIEEKP